MSKFFVKTEKINDDKIIIDTEDVNHIKNVLRKKIGDEILVCDYEKKINYDCEIKDILKNKIICEILFKKESENESNINIDIFQGLPKFDKMELIIQKGTELGVNNFIPVVFKRSVVKINEKDALKKIDRWQKIAEVAAKQSGRDIIPFVKNIENVKNICKLFENYDIVLVAYENEIHNSLKTVLKNIKNKNVKIAVVIGPEGGIDESEINLFKEAGAEIVSLGKRILRTETVCLSITAIINYELESTEEKYEIKK